MKKPKHTKEIVMIVVVLSAIAIVSGLLLGVMNKITYVDETKALIENIEKLYNSPITQLDIADYNNIVETEILNAFLAEDGAYIIESKSNKAYSSKGLKLITVIKEGKIIIIDGKGNSETPGLGTKALADTYLHQFIGLSYDYFDVEEEVNNPQSGLEYNWGIGVENQTGEGEATDDDNIKAISGATKSSDAVKVALKAALAFYEYMEGGHE